MRTLGITLGVFAFVSACDSHPREAKTPDPPLSDEPLLLDEHELYERHDHGCLLVGQDPPITPCWGPPRPVTAWGPVPFEAPPDALCPMRVRLDDAGEGRHRVIAEPFQPFDPLPFDECVPPKYQVGLRRVLRVEDGVLVAYSGAFDGEVYWEDESGLERSPISAARFVGFARAPSGTILALGVGRARLGLGGVVALDRRGRGEYTPRLVATLPVQPSGAVADDGGRILTFAQGFVVRIDENGKVENLHYVARDIGRVASIARTGDGVILLGLECGVLRIVPTSAGRDGAAKGRYYEEWWSAHDGASGHWSTCP